MSLQDLDTNHGDTTYTFSLNGLDFAVGGELSSQDIDNCIRIRDAQGQDKFDFHLLRQGVTIDLNPNGGTSYVTDLVDSPHAKIVCDSIIENATGGRGNDNINGNCYGNVLKGGFGGDSLTGQDGEDTFLFTGIKQSQNAAGLFDTITDYVAGEDWINLHKIDADRTQGGRQHFDWINHQNFHGVAGELRLTNGNVLLGDVNGDGVADFKIAVQGDTVNPHDILGVHF